jgi:hypothetical protein
MPRLLSERSRSYTPQGGTELSPGRPARRAVAVLAAPCMATCRVIGPESAEVIVGAGRYQKVVW